VRVTRTGGGQQFGTTLFGVTLIPCVLLGREDYVLSRALHRRHDSAKPSVKVIALTCVGCVSVSVGFSPYSVSSNSSVDIGALAQG